MSRTLRTLGAAIVIGCAIAVIAPFAASAATVAVYDDAAYVDSTNNSGAESDNLQASLAALGHTAKPFVGITAADFSAGLAGANALLIPEQENGNLAPNLSGDAVHMIRSYVASGGGLIIHGDFQDTGAADFLNRVFGIVVTEGQSPGVTTRQPYADGTAFASGPATLPANNGMDYLTGLPAGATPIYTNGANASVAAFAFGDGVVVFLGWDWFNSAPPNVGGQDGGWQNVLGRAVKEVAGVGCNITGSPGADVLTGTAGNDRICARGGSDTVNAGAGNDTVFAGRGSDTVNGGAGRDRLVGQAGSDTLNGNAGNDTLDARDGVRRNDHANGGTGTDRCYRDRGDFVRSCP